MQTQVIETLIHKKEDGTIEVVSTDPVFHPVIGDNQNSEQKKNP